MIKTNTDSNINPIFYAKKEDGYIIFLSQGGDEICRCVDASSDSSLPYKLNLTDSGRINLKDSSGNILSYVQQLSASEISSIKTFMNSSRLIHQEIFPINFNGSSWEQSPSMYSYKKIILNGGLVASLNTTSTTATKIAIKLEAGVYNKLDNSEWYVVDVALLQISTGGGGQISSAAYLASQSSSDRRNAFCLSKGSNSYSGLSFALDGITETEQGWNGVGCLISVYGKPLEAK